MGSTKPAHRGRYRLHPALDPTVDAMTRRRAGNANQRGGLERNLGLFRLRDDLPEPGAMPLTDAAESVFNDWDRQFKEGRVSDVLTDDYVRLVQGLIRFAGTRGVDLVSDLSLNVLRIWVQMPNVRTGEPVGRETQGVRRSAVRMFFETLNCLGITDANPGKLIELPSRGGRYVKALTDDQVDHVKRLAQTTLTDYRTPAAFAVVLSGATARELSNVTVDDVDLPNRRVWVHGGGYRQRDRWIPLLDDWCVNAVTAQVRTLREQYGEAAGGVWLVYKPHPTQPTPTRQASAANGILTRLMQTTRVHRPGITRVESIREWLAVKVFEETGSVEAVALRLGMSSLDGAAHLVGHDWVATADATHEPPAHREPTESADEHPDGHADDDADDVAGDQP